MEQENMEQIQEVVNQEVTNSNEQQPTENVDASASNQSVNGTEQVNQKTNLEEWQKDGRYGKMWKKTDDLYNSYKSMEKSFNDLNPKYKALINILKENGFTAETLNDDLKKYADYRNPESRINQIYNYVNSYLNNSLYADKIVSFFDELDRNELMRKYPNMNAEQIAKQEAMDKELKELKAKEAQRQADLAMQNDLATIQKGLDECQKLASEYGFSLTPDVKAYLLDYCSKNNIDPKYVKNEFISIYGQKLLEARDKKVIENQNANKKKLEQAKILGGGNNLQSPTPALKGRAALEAGLKRIFGK